MENRSKEKITEKMVISEIFSKYPERSQRLATAMTRAGLNCVGCGAASWETLEAGMIGHGKSPQEMETLLIDLNKILEEELLQDDIGLTEKAAHQFIKILEEEEKQGWGMRFGDKVGGCNGFEYQLDFCEKPEADDEIFEKYGVQIFVNKESLKRLIGSQIDYQEGLYGAGFKIINPNVKSACGCGTSHNY